MPPKSSKAVQDTTKEKWVPVTWMPHTSLSQTSHVGIMIRSAHAVVDRLFLTAHDDPEWKCRVGIYGMAGIALLPVSSVSSSSRARRRNTSNPLSTLVVTNATHDCEWNWYLSLPIRWRDLPRDAYLLFELFEEGLEDALYSTTLPLFSRHGRLCTGLQKLNFQSNVLSSSRNHGLVLKSESEERCQDEDPVWKAFTTVRSIERNEERIRTKVNDTFGEVPCVPWLDSLQKDRCREIIREHAKEETDPLLFDTSCASLVVELPDFDIPIMYEETFYPVPLNGASGAVAPADLAAHRKQRKSTVEGTFDPLELVTYLEYENESDNPCEEKYRTLAHELLRGLVDPALKPDKEQRARLSQIIDSPSHQLTREERDLLWRFRFSLVDNRRALTKFLVAVEWTVHSEVVQAVELLDQWRKRSPIEVTDALKLLGKNVAFQTDLVRGYAIDTLATAPDSELRLYLLQLVQAIKYENTTAVGSGSVGETETKKDSSLAAFLIKRASANVQLANYLYWYLKVESVDSVYGVKYQDVLADFKDRLSKVSFSMSGLQEAQPVDDSVLPFRSLVDSVSKLGSTLRKHADPSTDTRTRESKKQIKQRSMWMVLEEQDKFITGLLDVQLRCRTARGKKDAKESELVSLLSKEGFERQASRGPVPLPSTPEIFVNGVRPAKSKMFKSALYPAVLDFHVEGMLNPPKPEPVAVDSTSTVPKARQTAVEERVNSFRVIVKTGDDLRQDQLIIMMIQLMDRLLKRAALDLCLSPYSIIATSPNSGLVEFVDKSMPISEILASHNGSIIQFFQKNAPKKGAKYDVQPDVINTYVRSCSGYCVITYILGVGDRHLDNLMLRLTGHFFHIDFGFIFGRDPKPLPPAFRLTREMVDGMGGTDSSEYRQFCSLACQAFRALRKSAGLVLNLLSLMSDANIEDLSNNPSADAEGVLAKVEERFRLDLNDEQAERFFMGLINDCQAAIAPRVMDVFHSIAVARR